MPKKKKTLPFNYGGSRFEGNRNIHRNSGSNRSILSKNILSRKKNAAAAKKLVNCIGTANIFATVANYSQQGRDSISSKITFSFVLVLVKPK